MDSYDYKAKKIIAVLSDKLPAGLAANALGHLAFSAGCYGNESMMGQEEIVDGDGGVHIGIPKYPFIVLKATEEDIKVIVERAKEQNIFVVDYTQEAFDTETDEELVAALSKAQEPNLKYGAAVLVGDTDKLKTLTGHLKLYR